jgi:hypothetical protein
MRSRMLSLRFRSAAALAVAFSAQAARAQSLNLPAQHGTIRVEPKEIQVGLFYRGTKVHVDGTAPAGYRLALLAVGQEGKVELKRKGRVWGALWMNVGDVAFERVPSLYLAYTDSGGVQPQERFAPAGMRVGLKYDEVEAQVLSSQADESMRMLFREFIKLKEQEQLYSFGKLRLPNGGGGADPVGVSADFWLPASVPSGVYEVQMLGYREGRAELLASEKLITKRAGLVNLIASMAQRHGLLYGILSVLVAIATGFLTGVLFGLSSKKGH